MVDYGSEQALRTALLKRLYKYNNLYTAFYLLYVAVGLGILTWTRRPEPEPTQKYPIRNRTKNLQVSFGSNFFVPKRTGTEKEPTRIDPDPKKPIRIDPTR